MVKKEGKKWLKQKVEKGKRGAFIAELVKDSNVLYPAVKFAGLVVHEFDEEKNKNIINQLIDLALLSQGLLKGEKLSKFINRSIDIIK